MSEHRTNLVINTTTTTLPNDSDDPENVLLTQIAYPFYNQFHILKILEPEYAWQDFILHCYEACFVPLHHDISTKPVVCNRIALLLWAAYKPPSKEYYSWIQLYTPYLALVPLKVTYCKGYTTEERSIINHPSFYQQVVILPPSSNEEKKEAPTRKKTVTFARQTRSSRKRQRQQQDYEDCDEETGKQLALADARLYRATCIYNMSLGYCTELQKKVDYHRNVIVPQKEKQMLLYQKQRDELIEKTGKRLRQQ